jgi:hypothetical protein
VVRNKLDGASAFISRADVLEYTEPLHLLARSNVVQFFQQGTVELDAPAVQRVIDELQEWLDTRAERGAL